MCSNYSPSEQEIKKLEECIEKNEKDLKAMALSYAVEKGRVEAGVIKMEREARTHTERVEAEHNRQLTDLNHRLQGVADASARLEQEFNHRLQDSTSVSAADLAQLEQEMKKGREQAEDEHNRQLVDLSRRFQDETNTSVAYRIRLEEEIKELLGHADTAYVQVFCLVTHDN